MSQKELARKNIVKSFSAEFGVAPTIVEAVFEKYFGTDFWEREYSHFQQPFDEEPSDDEVPQEKHSQEPYEIGREGEESVFNLITLAKPDLEVNVVSSTGHVADLHVIDHNTNPAIRYIVEVKNKQTITVEDVNKFRRDLAFFDNAVGLFLSLRTNAIPKIGAFSISRDEVWLTQEYITKEHLQLIFSIMPLLRTVVIEKMQYSIPPEVLSCAANLKMLINKCDESITRLTAQTNKLKESISDNVIITSNEIISRDIAKALLDAFNIDDNTIQESAFEKEEVRLRECVSKVKNWNKKMLMERFPLHATDIASKSKNEIIDAYRPSNINLRNEVLKAIKNDTEFDCAKYYDDIEKGGIEFIREMNAKDKGNMARLLVSKGWIDKPRIDAMSKYLTNAFGSE